MSKELGYRLAVRLVVEFINHVVVESVEEWLALSNEAKLKFFRSAKSSSKWPPCPPVQERDSVCEDHLRRRVLVYEVIQVGKVHLLHGKFQYAAADLEWILAEGIDFCHQDTHQLLSDDFEAPAVWLFDELFGLLLGCDEVDVGPHILIPAVFNLYRVVHPLEEFIFEVDLPCCAQRPVFLDIQGEPPRLLEANNPLNIKQPHAVLRLEAQVEVVHRVLALLQQIWNELRRVCRAKKFGVIADLDLVVTQLLQLRIKSLRCQREVFLPFLHSMLACKKFPNGCSSVYANPAISPPSSAVIHSNPLIGIGLLIAHP